MHLSILYRGPLLSCNYGCDYCPFAKRTNTRAELLEDERALVRFVDWVEAQPQGTISVLMTPWGEGLVRRWYQEALVRLSHLPNVARAAIQTNLSGDVAWAADADVARLGLWCTFHPEWASAERFVAKVNALRSMRVRLSVGMVGFPRFAEAIGAMRRALPEEVYLWVNAVKDELGALPAEARATFEAVDPLFAVNTHHYRSLGRPCRGGESMISVTGDGTARRCHFIAEPIGNIYAADFAEALRPRVCTASTCHCHIGYVHMPELGLYEVFGEGVLERIPRGWPELRVGLGG